ncbi:MAG TPA: lysozyme inhibitor LprI family protein [Candidatus Udaeobacter sp.]
MALLIWLVIPVTQIHAQTQAAMNAEARADFKKADAELNKTYEAILVKLPDAQSKELLKQSQRAWLAFRDAEAALVADQAHGGTMAPTLRYATMTELTQQRIKQLKSHLEE